MDEREQAELQWIRQNRQREIDRAKKREKQLENIQSFEDLFEEEFYENIRRAKCSDRTLLKNHFEQNELIADMPVDLLINDNINADKTELAKIINNSFDGQWDKLQAEAKKITIEKHYAHNFAISANALVYAIFTVHKRRTGTTRRIFMYESHSTPTTINVEKELLFLNIGKNYEDIKFCNLADAKPFVSAKGLKIKKTAAKAESAIKQLRKELVSAAKRQINQNVNHIVSDINILSLDFKHILCPFYTVRFHTPWLDEKFVVNAQTKKCCKL